MNGIYFYLNQFTALPVKFLNRLTTFFLAEGCAAVSWQRQAANFILKQLITIPPIRLPRHAAW